MIGYIYVITNKINGKKYVGKTYGDIQKRFNEHIRDSRRDIKLNRPLCRAIRKYGKEAFFIEALDVCTENLEAKEIYWINKLGTYKNGYNATLGGDGKAYSELSSKEVINHYLIKNSIRNTAIFFKCDRSTIKKILINNGILIASVGVKAKKELSKPVKAYGKDNLEKMSFSSMMDAARYLKNETNTKASLIHIVSSIGKSCNKKRNTAYGYIWKAVDDEI